ncbi:hypothetical protein I5907_20355 [Panacibacter sp. DH6]|uniref:Lipoprotein n=1 Tax=Panacibacter microcysteis TaxID=2793269 RepID=A0A931H063_9BACT|nr:hypothetical protein [Panacibacter microcysteis]MBG9378596.1 hypothetical protein [Panacibacter microcysteis]
MKKLCCVLLLISALASCKKDKSELLVGRWDFTRLEMPAMYDLIGNIKLAVDNDEIALKRFLLGNKLILRSDSTFDMVMLKQYMHGNWHYDKTSQHLLLDDASGDALDITVRVDSITGTRLIFDIDQFSLNKIVNRHSSADNYYDLLLNKAYCQFYLDLDRDKYNDIKDDPYSIENNKWRIQPSAAESDAQIKDRVLNHLHFWKLLFADGQQFERPFISYNWFDSPLVVASNGVQLDFLYKHDKEWAQNFYDTAQAQRGYEMMDKGFDKKLKFMKTDNKYAKQEDMMKQLIENVDQSAK